MALLENTQLHTHTKNNCRKNKCFIHKKYTVLFAKSWPENTVTDNFPTVILQQLKNVSSTSLRSRLTWQAVPSCKYHCLIWRVWSGAQTQAQEMAGFDSIRRQFFTSSNYPFLTTIWNSHRGPAFTYGIAEVGSS